MARRSWKCEGCGVEFNTKKDMAAHQESVGCLKRDVKCRRCGEFFTPSSYMVAVHRGCSRMGA